MLRLNEYKLLGLSISEYSYLCARVTGNIPVFWVQKCSLPECEDKSSVSETSSKKIRDTDKVPRIYH